MAGLSGDDPVGEFVVGATGKQAGVGAGSRSVFDHSDHGLVAL
jgi:hypothetical protein